ncbi:MAG: 3-deoxy-manno-octulosonate cytidylyltransferase [Elusimicrobiales bacterium]
MADTVFVIPARYGSVRFPGKVLAEISGKSVVRRVYEACSAAGMGEVIIATEDERVAKAAAAFGAKYVITSPRCASGTDRVWEAASGRGEKFIINVQGDEPFISTATIAAAARLLQADPQADISSACFEITNPDDITNPNSVKAVLDGGGRALYFSRSPAPYHHQLSEIKDKVPYYKHCGIYGYRRAALEKFVSLPPSRLELLERLEQLRALEAGMTIKCAVCEEAGPAIDTPQDLIRAEEYLRAHNLITKGA